MRTMYRVETREYTDCEARSSKWFVLGDTYYTTKEEAEAKAIEKNAKATKNGYFCGDYRVIERTVDEATFTVIDTIVVDYNYFNEVERYEIATRLIETYTKEIARLEASKKNCKTKRGLANIEKVIADCKEKIEKKEKILAERKG